MGFSIFVFILLLLLLIFTLLTLILISGPDLPVTWQINSIVINITQFTLEIKFGSACGILFDMLDDIGPIFSCTVAFSVYIVAFLVIFNTVYLQGHIFAFVVHELRAIRYFNSFADVRGLLIVLLQKHLESGTILSRS